MTATWSRMSGSALRGTTASCDRQVGSDPPHGAERLLAPLPEPGALRRRLGPPHLGGAVAQEQGLDRGGLRRDRRRRAIHLDEEDGPGIHRIAGRVNRGFDGADTGLVHHLHRGGHDAGGDDAAHRLAGASDRRKRGQQGAHPGGQRGKPEGDLQGDPEHSFASHEQPDQVRSPGLPAR